MKKALQSSTLEIVNVLALKIVKSYEHLDSRDLYEIENVSDIKLWVRILGSQ